MDLDFIQILKDLDGSEIEPEVRTLSISYLEKYWLDELELNSYWLPRKNRVFNPASKDLPDLMFNGGYELIAQKAGVLFTKDEYLAFQKCMKDAGDDYFVVIENNYSRCLTECLPRVRFKFPVGTTWLELNNGNESFPDISYYDLIFNPQKHFFVFGNNCKWGKYSANDYDSTPLDIIGFKAEISSLFRAHFSVSQEEQIELSDWLPSVYREKIKW